MKITAGLPFESIFTLSGYSASSGWSVSARIGAATPIALSGAGEDWTLSLNADATAELAAGDSVIYLIGSLGGNEKVLGEIPLTIVALGTVSHARQMVTLLEQSSKGLASKKFIELTTPGGESIKLDREGVEKQLEKYRRELKAEERKASGKKKIGSVNYRFRDG